MAQIYENPSGCSLKTAGGIPYTMISQEMSFEEESATATVEMLVEANRINDLALEFFPTPYLFGGFPVYPAKGRIAGTAFQVRRITAKGHVDGKPIDMLGLHTAPPAGTYQPVALVTIEYSTELAQDESNPNDPGTFVEISASSAGEYLHVSGNKAKWKNKAADAAGDAEDNKDPNLASTIIVPEVDWSVRWPRIPYSFFWGTLMDRMRDGFGKVNSASMPIFADAPQETILMVGWSLQRQFTWRGTSTPFTADMKFLEKAIFDKKNNTYRGHNDFWRKDVGWQYLLFDGTNPVYDSYDLNTLFQP